MASEAEISFARASANSHAVFTENLFSRFFCAIKESSAADGRRARMSPRAIYCKDNFDAEVLIWRQSTRVEDEKCHSWIIFPNGDDLVSNRARTKQVRLASILSLCTHLNSRRDGSTTAATHKEVASGLHNQRFCSMTGIRHVRWDGISQRLKSTRDSVMI